MGSKIANRFALCQGKYCQRENMLPKGTDVFQLVWENHSLPDWNRKEASCFFSGVPLYTPMKEFWFDILLFCLVCWQTSTIGNWFSSQCLIWVSRLEKIARSPHTEGHSRGDVFNQPVAVATRRKAFQNTTVLPVSQFLAFYEQEVPNRRWFYMQTGSAVGTQMHCLEKGQFFLVLLNVWNKIIPILTKLMLLA